ncbi:MAG TPA: hypothetical protein VNF99_01240 [Stellaceae bacterium]|nr:hypothetical protein [Stellaceae bacterium]
MMRILRPLVLLAVLGLQGCSLFTIADGYGNTYGNFFDYGNRYTWQLATCQSDLAAGNVDAKLRQRWMQCCMWRHGVPIDDHAGCAAPPYYSG